MNAVNFKMNVNLQVNDCSTSSFAVTPGRDPIIKVKWTDNVSSGGGLFEVDFLSFFTQTGGCGIDSVELLDPDTLQPLSDTFPGLDTSQPLSNTFPDL